MTMVPDNNHLKQLIVKFLRSEWPKVEEYDLSIRKIATGMVNTVLVVSRPHDPSHKEPEELVVRLNGGMMVPVENFSEFVKLTESEELLIASELSRQGWGPALIGIFAGGRVEEYIPSKNLTPKQSCDPEIRKQMAVCYARFHSLQPPLRKDRFRLSNEDTIQSMRYSPAKLQQMRQRILETGSQYAEEANASMLNHSEELQWILTLFPMHKCRESFVHRDPNFLNILIRDKPAEGKSDVVLVDYELATYAYRGIDIAGYFFNRMIEWQNKVDKISGLSYPDRWERRAFCIEYLAEWTEMGQLLDHKIDTLDHLMLEVDIGAIFYTCYMSSVLYRYIDVFLPPDSAFVSAMKLLNQVYGELKSQYCTEQNHITR